MIRFARRHPVFTSILLIFAVALASKATPNRTAQVIEGWIILGAIVFLLVRWRRNRGKPKQRNEPKPLPIRSAPIPQAQQPVQPTSWRNRAPMSMSSTIAVPSASAPTPPAFVPTRSSFALPTLGDVLMLTPAQFEETTRDLLTAIGFHNMTRCGGSGDLGVDLKGSDRQGRSVCVQCKRFAPGVQVSSPQLQSFIGMMTVHHQAERGVYVTTATYSLPAINLAAQHGISLINGDGLLLLLGLTGVLNGSASPTMAQERRYPMIGTETRPGSSNGAAALKSPPKFCTSCGASRDADSTYCANCGSALNGAGASGGSGVI